MHVCDLVELAGIAAEDSQAILCQPFPISDREISNYVAACRTRFELWTAALDETVVQDAATPRDELTVKKASPSEVVDIHSLIEEVLISEILTRVWTGVVAGSERKHQSSDVAANVRSVFVDHLEIRRRILRLLVHGHPVVSSGADALNRLRRRVERWTDLLIGRLALVCDVDGLAFDAIRAKDFAASFYRESNLHDWETTWHLVMMSLKTSFSCDRNHESPSVAENLQIASSVSQCLTSHPSQESSAALPWHLRIDQTTRETEGLVQQLLQNEGTI